MSTRLQHWIGRTEVREDVVTAAPVAGLAATLDRDDPYPLAGDVLPPLWHWLFFLPLERQSRLGPEGHAERGGFMPPVALPRRMWAGSRFVFHHPLRIGDAVRRKSEIADVREKEGRTGPLVFVVVRHEISNGDGLALTEEQDIVYRERPRPGVPSPPVEGAPSPAEWEREIRPDDVLLFRYSALTFNGHRIHYDRRYATGTEGYPGLVVHGPLLATLLLDLLRSNRPDAGVAAFRFRAVSPLFDTDPFWICGARDGETRVNLWARNPVGGLAVSAEATLNED